MISPTLLFVTVLGYVAILFGVATLAERKERSGMSLVSNPYIYSLSLAVYCTSWTFYGSVGRAAGAGLSFLPIYLGPVIVSALWPILLEKLIRAARLGKVTTLPEFISVRYGNSRAISVIVTCALVIGVIPYIALQLKAITKTFAIVSGLPSVSMFTGLAITLMIGFFTIAYGTRSGSNDRHGGLIFVIAFESLVKLIAFLLVGLFVTYYLFDGFHDIYDRAMNNDDLSPLLLNLGTANYLEWSALTLLSMVAVMFLPRQFQVLVLENRDMHHVYKASWLFPLYLLLINFFVLPIALGGLLAGGTAAEADYFVLTLPFVHGSKYLAILAFIGGFSAATGMIIVESLALGGMVDNCLIKPLLSRYLFVQRHPGFLLTLKRLAIVAILTTAYLFTVSLGAAESLVEIGLKSFEAVTVLAPPILLGIYWKRANRIGAMAGISAGFLIWLYTTMVPLLLKAELLSQECYLGELTRTPFFNPASLFCIAGFGKSSHTLFWILFFDLGLMVFLSLATKQSDKEKELATLFVDGQELCETAGDLSPLRDKVPAIVK